MNAAATGLIGGVSTDVWGTEGFVPVGNSATKFSGSFDKHYSPLAEIILDTEPTASDGFIAISAIPTPINVVRLSAPKDVQDFARSLYSSLRKADQNGMTRIVVAQPEGEGLAEAIRERLSKAANGR